MVRGVEVVGAVAFCGSGGEVCRGQYIFVVWRGNRTNALKGGQVVAGGHAVRRLEVFVVHRLQLAEARVDAGVGVLLVCGGGGMSLRGLFGG
jgi:hypothetical protein